MEIQLQNSFVTATINTLGAELTKLVKNETNVNYMWIGDTTYWGGRSPVLFPIVGGLVDDQYVLDGHVYEMNRHGFARKSEFKLMEQDQTSAVFRLESNDDTLAMYPYHFSLDLVYSLTDRGINIDYIVRNFNDHMMPFQLGTHPAFSVTLGNSHRLEDWYLEFEVKESLKRFELDGPLIDLNNQTAGMENSNILNLKSEDYYRDAIVFRNIKSRWIRLVSSKTPESVKVSFENMFDLGIWQAKDAPFICIELWHGHADVVGFTGDFTEKEHVIKLDHNCKFNAALTIEID